MSPVAVQKYLCAICGSVYDSVEEAEVCEALGMPVEEPIKVGDDYIYAPYLHEPLDWCMEKVKEVTVKRSHSKHEWRYVLSSGFAFTHSTLIPLLLKDTENKFPELEVVQEAWREKFRSFNCRAESKCFGQCNLGGSYTCHAIKKGYTIKALNIIPWEQYRGAEGPRLGEVVS